MKNKKIEAAKQAVLAVYPDAHIVDLGGNPMVQTGGQGIGAGITIDIAWADAAGYIASEALRLAIIDSQKPKSAIHQINN